MPPPADDRQAELLAELARIRERVNDTSDALLAKFSELARRAEPDPDRVRRARADHRALVESTTERIRARNRQLGCCS
jgi:hypothetical protein